MKKFLRRFTLLAFTLLVVLFQHMEAGGDTAKKGSLQDKYPHERRRGTFAGSGGFYAGGSGGSEGALNTFRATLDADINARLREARQKGLINVVQLVEPDRWRGDLHKAQESLSRWLRSTQLSLIDVLHLCEEHPASAAANLDRIYEQIKAADPTLPVYVWPSYPLGPFGKSDGWVYDAYGADYTDFRRIAFDFLRTGKPLIVCIDGSGYSDIRSAREQLMVCHELNLPVCYFVADGGSGGINNWRGLARAALIPWRHFVFSGIEFQRLCRNDSFTAADMLWGEPIELGSGDGNKFAYTWQCLGPATVFGFTNLNVNNERFGIKSGRSAALDLPYWSVFPVKKAEFKVSVNRDPENSIKVKLSRCGQKDDWKELPGRYADGNMTYQLGDSLAHEFRVRIELAGNDIDENNPLFVGGYSLSGEVNLPHDRAFDLDFFFDGWREGIRLRQDFAAGQWRSLGIVDNAGALEPDGSPALRGLTAGSVTCTIIEKFTSAKPLANLAVRLTGFENRRNLGGTFSLGISLDGKEVLKKAAPELDGIDKQNVRPDGSFNGTICLDLSSVPKFSGCRTFYVHLQQQNNSGVRGNISSKLERLEIDADYKKP